LSGIQINVKKRKEKVTNPRTMEWNWNNTSSLKNHARIYLLEFDNCQNGTHSGITITSKLSMEFIEFWIWRTRAKILWIFFRKI
jgi:hypothetical protein